jgi:hypothetical protein
MTPVVVVRGDLSVAIADEFMGNAIDGRREPALLFVGCGCGRVGG